MSLFSPSWRPAILLVIFLALLSRTAGHQYGRGFFNHTGCLYAYLESGKFEMSTADGDYIEEELKTKDLSYDSGKSRCSENEKHGKLVFSFKVDERTKIKLVTVSMKIFPSLSEGYWEISQANLTITRADIERRRTFQLNVMDVYAGLDHSYSCNEFKLNTMHKKKMDNETGRVEPRASITLKRFQVQPFAELDKVVFGPSFDCSTWFSLAGVMGFVLILFMTSVTVVGALFLSTIETNDFKYVKEGLLFTQSQMESNKRN